MSPDRFLPDGDLNPDWVEWVDSRLAAMGQFSGFGVEEVGGPFGFMLREPDEDAHWVRVTLVDATKTPPRHGVEEVYRDPSAGINAYQWATRPGGLRLDLPESWCVEAMGGTAAVDDVVLVRRDAGGLWTFALGGGDDSFWAALVTKTGSTCPSYTFRRVTSTGTACGWTVDDAVASPEGPLYEVNACDLPINDPVVDDPDQFIVVRARPGPGAFFVFEEASRWEFVKTTSSTPDAITGYYPGVILTFSTGGSTVDAEVIWIWDLNATP